MGQAGLNFLKSAPNSIISNFGSGMFGGAGFKALDGVTNMLNVYGDKGQASLADFTEGVRQSAQGDAQAVKNVLTGNGKFEDYVAVAMLLIPGGKKGSNNHHNNSHISSPDAPHKNTPHGDAEGGGKPKDGDEGGATPRSHATETNSKEPKDRDAYAEGGDAPIKPSKPSYQHGQSDGGPGTWENRATPEKGAEYQQKVTGAPKDTEYVVKTDKMKSGEKKFDGYDPETNTLKDAKDWSKWPPEGDSKFANFARDKEVANIRKDAQIAADQKANLEYHVPTDAKKNQLLEMLGDDIPENFDIKVTSKN